MPTTLEITPDYMICGDFDSRNRYLRADGSGPIAICSGITWELSGGVARFTDQSNTPWCAYRFNITGFSSINATTQTWNGGTRTVVVSDPVNTVTRVNF